MAAARAYRLEGSSMLPVFRPGELALAGRGTRPPRRWLRPGDCAIYELGGRTLLHRVLKTGPDGAWFADDAGRLEPHFVAWKNVYGKVLSRNPLAGGLCGRLYSRLRRFANASLRKT
ncbi:MAG: S24/S26 family peptidase [Elusimicrobia bacterium]|nr:S24/S26 family peptidase [Elusimicrobiota bacterium]